MKVVQHSKSEKHLKKNKTHFNMRRTIDLTVMAIIPLCLLICFRYVPLTGLQLAFKDFNYTEGIFGSPWVGLANFKFLFSSVDAWRITKNTILMNSLFIITTTAGGIAGAIILNELYPATDVIDTYVYRALMIDGDIGKSAATGLYQSVVGFVLVIITNQPAKKYDKNSAIF